MSKNYKGNPATDKTLGWPIPSTIKEVKLEYIVIERQVKYLQGKVLTILEASCQNETQLQAIKGLVKDTFSSQLSWIYELCGYPAINTLEVPAK